MNPLSKLNSVNNNAASSMVLNNVSLRVISGVSGKTGKDYRFGQLSVLGGQINCNVPSELSEGLTPQDVLQLGSCVVSVEINERGIKAGQLLAVYGNDKKLVWCLEEYNGINLGK
jgi:hypothetical protein